MKFNKCLKVLGKVALGIFVVLAFATICMPELITVELHTALTNAGICVGADRLSQIFVEIMTYDFLVYLGLLLLRGINSLILKTVYRKTKEKVEKIEKEKKVRVKKAKRAKVAEAEVVAERHEAAQVQSNDDFLSRLKSRK